MTKQAYHLEERLLKKAFNSSFHYCIFLRLRRMSEPNEVRYLDENQDG
jgi:hypothetical protein